MCHKDYLKNPKKQIMWCYILYFNAKTIQTQISKQITKTS